MIALPHRISPLSSLCVIASVHKFFTLGVFFCGVGPPPEVRSHDSLHLALSSRDPSYKFICHSFAGPFNADGDSFSTPSSIATLFHDYFPCFFFCHNRSSRLKNVLYDTASPPFPPAVLSLFPFSPILKKCLVLFLICSIPLIFGLFPWLPFWRGIFKRFLRFWEFFIGAEAGFSNPLCPAVHSTNWSLCVAVQSPTDARPNFAAYFVPFKRSESTPSYVSTLGFSLSSPFSACLGTRQFSILPQKISPALSPALEFGVPPPFFVCTVP